MRCNNVFRTPVAAFAAAVAFGAFGARAGHGDLEVRGAYGDSEIMVRTCAQHAGAVCSVRFRGREHIDTKDHGRLLQSASFFDYYEECLNPTEAGAQRDRESSTSVLISAHAEANRLRTVTDMAYWLRPGQRRPRGCGRHPAIMEAVNTKSLSGHLIEKKITIGLPGFPNVIEHRVVFNVPESYSHGVFEASTGYMPAEFSLHQYFDPVTRREIDPGTRQGEQSRPVILATPDRKFAMGVYSPDLPQKGLGYGRFTFQDVVKWNCVYRRDNVTPGAYPYRCLVILGSLAEVQDTITRLDRTRGGNTARPD